MMVIMNDGSVIRTDSDLNITDCVFMLNTGNALGGYQSNSTADITILIQYFGIIQ